MVNREVSNTADLIRVVVLSALLAALLSALAYFVYQVLFLPGFSLGGMGDL